MFSSFDDCRLALTTEIGNLQNQGIVIKNVHKLGKPKVKNIFFFKFYTIVGRGVRAKLLKQEQKQKNAFSRADSLWTETGSLCPHLSSQELMERKILVEKLDYQILWIFEISIN